MEEVSQKACSVCNDSGWTEVVESGVLQVKRCDCYKHKLRDRLLELARIPARYRLCNFESYDNRHPSQKEAKKKAEKFVKLYPDVDAGLFFIGSCGVGKTHLSVAVIQALIKTKKIPCIFFDWP